MSLDNYEIIKELGRGGMGAVFLANDKRLKRQVAIKVLKVPPGSSQSSIEDTINNFKREAVAIANLAHNNIVCVYDIGNQDNVHYIVMELIDGSPLSKILKLQGHPFSLETVLKMSEEICDSLIYVHKNNVIHRDIKPENIIYTAKGISKLTDFGIAKFVGDEQLQVEDQPGTIKGTILYISPEQLQNPEGVDGRADLYSYAVSMYELLTGQLPFDGESPREVIMKILQETPIAPSKIAKDLLPHIDPVLLKAMAKEPDKRYSSVSEFRDELRNISEFRTKFAMQPMKISDKEEEKVYYSQVHLNSFDDIAPYIRKLPETGQQRFMYQIEMMLSKYMEEYKDDMKKVDVESTNSSSDTFGGNQLYESDESLSPFVQSFAYIVPNLTPEGSIAARTMTLPMDLRIFMGKLNGKSTFKQIIDDNYSSASLYTVFNNLYNAAIKGHVSLEVLNKPKESILIGDMMITLEMVSKFQFNQCMIKKNQQTNSTMGKFIGEMLLDSGFITRDKLLHILKLQHWYRRLFA